MADGEAGVYVGRPVRKHCRNPGKRRWREVEIKLTKLVNGCGEEREVKMQNMAAEFVWKEREIKSSTLNEL